GTAESTRTSSSFTEQFCHAGVGTGSPRQSMSVVAVSCNDVIVVACRRDRATDHCLLADVKMTKAADLLRLILLTGALLKTPDQQHQREHLDFVALLRRRH